MGVEWIFTSNGNLSGRTLAEVVYVWSRMINLTNNLPILTFQCHELIKCHYWSVNYELCWNSTLNTLSQWSGLTNHTNECVISVRIWYDSFHRDDRVRFPFVYQIVIICMKTIIDFGRQMYSINQKTCWDLNAVQQKLWLSELSCAPYWTPTGNSHAMGMKASVYF